MVYHTCDFILIEVGKLGSGRNDIGLCGCRYGNRPDGKASGVTDASEEK